MRTQPKPTQPAGCEPRIYETGKMKVEIGLERVVKIFKSRSDAKRRYMREKKSLRILSDLVGVPDLLDFNDVEHKLVMARLSGISTSKYSDENLIGIRYIIEEALRLGIARHSLPDRDILVDAGTVGIVDFERVSIRVFEYSPLWKIAKLVSRFHLFRLISNHNSSLLSSSELRFLSLGISIRKPLTYIKYAIQPLRDKWRYR